MVADLTEHRGSCQLWGHSPECLEQMSEERVRCICDQAPPRCTCERTKGGVVEPAMIHPAAEPELPPFDPFEGLEEKA